MRLTPYRKKQFLISQKRNLLDPVYQREIEDQKILSELKRHHGVLYGAQSLNRNVSGFIKRPTQDYDIMINNPQAHARHLERSLDRRMGGDFYKVKPAMHKGTFKVCTKTGKERCIADFSSPADFKDLATTEREGIKMSSLKFEKSRRKKILKDKEYKFRWNKAKRDLEMIKYQEEINKAPIWGK
jgi:hypothetical protein